MSIKKTDSTLFPQLTLDRLWFCQRLTGQLL